jgi:hypothetical protein
MDDPRGEPLVQDAILGLPKYASGLLGLLGAYYARSGRVKDLETLRERQVEQSTVEAAAEEEAQRLKPGDEMVASSLTPAEREQLTRELKRVPEIAEAYVVGKRVSALGNDVVNHVFVFRKARALTEEHDQKLWKLAAAQISLGVYLWAPGKRGPWTKSFEKVPDSKLI